MSRRKVTTTIAFTPEQLAGLRECSARTRVPIAEIVREGVELALQARAERVPTHDTAAALRQVAAELKLKGVTFSPGAVLREIRGDE